MVITSELTNQSARKALFTCVVYTNNINNSNIVIIVIIITIIIIIIIIIIIVIIVIQELFICLALHVHKERITQYKEIICHVNNCTLSFKTYLPRMTPCMQKEGETRERLISLHKCLRWSSGNQITIIMTMTMIMIMIITF